MSVFFFFSSRRRHTRLTCDWSSDVCSSDLTVLADREDEGLLRAAAQVRAMAGGRGVDAAFECTSVPALCAAPLSFVRNGGRAIQLSGTEQPVTVNMELFEWDKIYLNPLYGQCRPEVDLPRLFRFYQEGRLQLDEMITRTYP